MVWLMKNESADSMKREWLSLMLDAKEIGLSPKEIRAFIRKNQVYSKERV